MVRSRTTLVTALLGGALLAAVPAHGATVAPQPTPAQFGAKCRAAWTGPTGTPAFGAYQSKCVKAAARATDAATDAGNPGNPVANRARATAACAIQYPKPRTTPAKRSAFAACVRAASASQFAFAGRPLKATLAGQSEVPPSGNATGTALIRLNQGRKRVCYTLNVTGLNGSPVTAAHIHAGAAGVNGNPVVALETNLAAIDTGGAAKGCVQNVDADLIKAIRQKPGDYYVNVHTAAFPGGAARGQLSK